MASQGPNNCGTAANAAGGGVVGWTVPASSYLSAADGDDATVAPPEGTESQYLKATNFGFSIPSGATINGVVAEFSDGGFDNEVGKSVEVKLVKGGTIQGSDKSTGTIIDDGTYHSFGGAADLWGLSLSVADVNASDFGVALRVASLSEETSGGTIYMDHCRITVYYTEGASGGAKVDGVTTPAKVDGVTSPAKVMGV